MIRLVEFAVAFALIVAGVCWLVNIPAGLIAAGVLLLVELAT